MMGKMLKLVERIENFLAESDEAWNVRELQEEFAVKGRFPTNEDVADALDILVWGEIVEVRYTDARKFPSYTYYLHMSNLRE